MIGHAKTDGRLGRNWLLGTAGDKINATLAAAGHNLRLVLRRLALLFAQILRAVIRLMPNGGQTIPTRTPKSVFPNICIGLSGLRTSTA